MYITCPWLQAFNKGTHFVSLHHLDSLNESKWAYTELLSASKSRIWFLNAPKWSGLRLHTWVQVSCWYVDGLCNWSVSLRPLSWSQTILERARREYRSRHTAAAIAEDFLRSSPGWSQINSRRIDNSRRTAHKMRYGILQEANASLRDIIGNGYNTWIQVDWIQVQYIYIYIHI